MNTLTACNYNNCFLQFKNVHDYIGHYESKHLPDNEWRRIRDVEDLEKAIEDAKDVREKEKLQEHLNNLYNQPLRISLFYKLDPHPAEHAITPQEKKPLTLQFTNYRKRPAANPPTIVTPKKSAKNISNVNEAVTADQSIDERKYHCTVEGCKKSYKNSAGLRSHMRSVHNNLSAQQQNRTSVSPAPNYATANAHIAYMPSNQDYYAPKEELKPNDGQMNSAGSIGSLATFNASTSRLHGSDEGFVQPGNLTYRSGSRLTQSEESILNRNLTTLPAAPQQRAGTPSSNAQPPVRMQDGKYKCDYCPKTYKANANLQKHINDHHARQINLDAGSNQRPVLSKNVLRTYSIGSNQPQVGGATISSQQPPMQNVQQSKSTLLSTKSSAHPTTRSPASPGMVAHSPNLSPVPHISVQPTNQRQIAVGNPQNVQQRTYLQTRTYAPPQSQNQPIYHLQQIQQTGDTPQSLDIQIPQSQSSVSPRSYSSSPVTVVLQPQQQQPSPTVQGQQQIPAEHYQQGPQGPNVRPPAARTYTSQQYYERYQNSVQQRRPTNKGYGTGNYAYQPKQIKQVFRQSSGQEYPRLSAPAAGSMNRVNTVSSTGQPVRITSLNTQSGGPMMSSGHMAGTSGQPVSGTGSQMPTTYQVRTNFESSRRSPQVSSGSLSSQLAPLNVSYGNTTTTTTSIDGIQIMRKNQVLQDGNPRTAIRTGSNAVRGRLPDNVRGGQMYGQGGMPPRYGAQPQYTQRIMRVVQSPGNPPVLQQQEPTSQRVHHQPVSSQHSHQSNASDN